MKHSRALLSAAAVALVAIAARGRPVGGAAIELSVAGRSNAYPSIATDGRSVVIAWAASTPDGVTDVYVATSRDAGRTFGTPHRVNDVSDAANLSGEQPPRVVLAGGDTPSIIVLWTAKGPAGTQLLSARSDDGGVSFTGAAAVLGSDASGSRGWEAAAVDPKGRVAAIWLDHRELAAHATGSAPMTHAGQAHTGHGDRDGAARAQRSKLYFAKLGDASARPLFGGVCYCCKTALATGADGSIYAAWRHVYPGNIRDIAFTVSRDSGRTFAQPVRVSEDQWALDGCPENGPAIAVDSRRTVHVVWPTLVSGSTASSDPALSLFHAATRDGRTFSSRHRIPTTGTPRHPQIAIASDGSLLVAWDEQVDAARRVVLARGTAGDRDTISFLPVSVETTERSEYPAVAAVDDRFVVASTSGPRTHTTIRIERVAPQPSE